MLQGQRLTHRKVAEVIKRCLLRARAVTHGRQPLTRGDKIVIILMPLQADVSKRRLDLNIA